MTDSRNWEASLGEVEAGVEQCLAELDRFEARFADVLAGGAAAGVSGNLPTPREGWEAALAEARQLSEAIDRELLAQETAWRHWQEAMAVWATKMEGMVSPTS